MDGDGLRQVAVRVAWCEDGVWPCDDVVAGRPETKRQSGAILWFGRNLSVLVDAQTRISGQLGQVWKFRQLRTGWRWLMTLPWRQSLEPKHVGAFFSCWFGLRQYPR